MADETTQTGEETSWWAFDAFADSELPSTAFDEPLEWPDTLNWDDFAAGDGDLQFPSIDDLAAEPIFPDMSLPAPEAPAAPPSPPQAADDGDDPTMPHVTVLSGLGGGAAPPAPAGDHAVHERLPDSVWAPDAPAGANGNGNGAAPLVTTTMAAPAYYAEPDRGGGGWRRFDLRHGNAAVIALISFVSLVLLGMFLSVRARNDVPDTSQTRTTSDQIAVQGPLNTIPLTTTVTTTAPPINIADLVPPPEDATAVTTGAGGSGSGGGGSTATTAAPARSTPAGGTTGTTQPAAQAPATTAAPPATTQPETTPAPTTPPVDQTTPSVPRRTTPTFPSITSTVPGNDGPTYTIPSIPGFGGFPMPNNNNSN